MTITLEYSKCVDGIPIPSKFICYTHYLILSNVHNPYTKPIVNAISSITSDGPTLFHSVLQWRVSIYVHTIDHNTVMVFISIQSGVDITIGKSSILSTFVPMFAMETVHWIWLPIQAVTCQQAFACE